VEAESELVEGALLLLVAFLPWIAIFPCACLSSSRRCSQLQQWRC